MFPTVQKVSLFVNYNTSRQYINLKYCENRLRPSLKCHGKCEMMKRMNQGISKEIPGSRVQEIQEVQLFVEDTRVTASCAVRATVSYMPFPAAEISDCSYTIFHPPCIG